jgi:hypothetical protein
MEKMKMECEDKLISLFKEYFSYNSGKLYWKIDSGTRGRKGTLAGKQRLDGYFDVGLKGKYYLVHRIIYALHHGSLPKIVDHVNRIPFDNRIENLRASDYNKNIWNSGISSANSTGVKGVRLTKNDKYEARLAVNNKTIQVGTFETLQEAEDALCRIRQKEHGEYSCNG